MCLYVGVYVSAGSWEGQRHWMPLELRQNFKITFTCVHVLKLKDNFSEVNFLLLLGVGGWLPRIEELWWAGWAASAFTHLSHLSAQSMKIFNRLKFKDQNQCRITTVGGWWLLTSLGRGPGFGFQNEPMWQFTTTCNSSFSRPSALFWPVWASVCRWGTCIHSGSHIHIKKKKQVLRDT